jgi:KUP system potassium uptake protein
MTATPALERQPEHHDAPPHDPHIPGEKPRGKYLLTLSVAALGIVYGDIGTSPLYALRECFHGEHAIAPTPTNIMGVLSLVFWALVLVISGGPTTRVKVESSR